MTEIEEAKTRAALLSEQVDQVLLEHLEGIERIANGGFVPGQDEALIQMIASATAGRLYYELGERKEFVAKYHGEFAVKNFK